MRFLLGVIIGISIAVGGALLHDNNVPARTLPRTPDQLRTQAIVDWEVLGQVVRDQTSAVGRWWDSLMGRGAPQP